ncbi:ArnT family glycosyltransferase [Mycolicibacterium tusciae]|uniref:ArnT family glycosyltransferase n=1 Tax=Mycolicibacterium tusciae TaxID=75922 RepID=UPI00024A124B|nr:glycosyltransferase family 39 protein [Mycolicibacterium tusciae]
MTTTKTETASDRQIAPFATGVVLPIAGVVAVLHCAAGGFGRGYWFDEVYMLAIGRNHLDWGSADQPPVTPLLAALMDAVAPGSMMALRIPAAIATAGAVVVAGLIASELGCDRRAQGFTAVAQATALWSTLAGHWLTPYTLEPVQWLLLIWLLVRWVRVRRDRLLVAFGAVAGLAALTKFQVLLLCAVLLVAVAAVGPRDLLRRPLLWVGVAIAALLAAPTMAWQYANGWPQLHMASVVADEAEALYGGRPGIAVQLIVYAGVAGVLLVLYGLWRVFRDPALRDYRFLGVTLVVLYVFFVATAGRPYYLAGLYAALAAMGALGLQRRRESGASRTRWLFWPTVAMSVGLAIGMLVLSVALISDDVGQRIAQRTADVYHALPDAQRDRTVVIGQSYIVAAYIDGYSVDYSLPKAFSLNRSYGYFPPPPADSDDALYVGSDLDDIRPYFTDVRRLGDIGEDMGVYLLTGRQRPWDQIWSQARSLTVS